MLKITKGLKLILVVHRYEYTSEADVVSVKHNALHPTSKIT